MHSDASCHMLQHSPGVFGNALQGRYNQASEAQHHESQRCQDLILNQQRAGLQAAELALSASAEEGFRHLEEERRLRELSRELATAAEAMQAAEKRAGMMTAVREAMRQRLMEHLGGGGGGCSSVSDVVETDDWHDFTAADGS